MDVLAIVNQDNARSGVLAEPVARGGHRLVEWCAWEGDGPPGGLDAYDALIVLGGDVTVHDEDEHPWLRAEKALLREALAREVPTLGVCLGGQLLADVAGAPVRLLDTPEIGWVPLARDASAAARSDALLGPEEAPFTAFEWHSWRFDVPDGATPLVANATGPQALRVGQRAWALQFHPEVTDEILAGWTSGDDSARDLARAGLVPADVAAGAREHLAESQALGRRLAERLLAVAAG